MSNTVAQILARARWRADKDDYTARHTDADLVIEFNASMRELRSRLFQVRSPGVLDSTLISTTVGASLGHGGTVLAPSLGAGNAIAGVALLKAQIDGLWEVLLETGQAAEADWQLESATLSRGPPERYVLLPYYSGNAGLQIMILPACDRVYTVALTYMPQWTDATTSTAIQTDLPTIEWLVNDLARKMAERDNEPDGVARFAAAADAKAVEIMAHHRRLLAGAPRPVRPVPLPRGLASRRSLP